MHLSSIRIPLSWCQPEIQRRRKQTLRATSHITKWAFLSLLFNPIPSYALPGTSHALVPETSLDTFRQQQLTNTVIDQLTSQAATPSVVPMTADDAIHTDDAIPSQPHSFVVDTDSIKYLVDTGTNRIIINNPKLLTNFTPSIGNVKGIGGSPVLIRGHGNHTLNLSSDSGQRDSITIPDAVYVPTSPYNLIPPQLLVRVLKQNDYKINWFRHDDKQYVFDYTPQHQSKSKRTLTIDLDERGMFTFHSTPGYKNFMCYACDYDPEWQAFPGYAHIIPDDDVGELSFPFNPTASLPRESPQDAPGEDHIGDKNDIPRESPVDVARTTPVIPLEIGDLNASNKPTEKGLTQLDPYHDAAFNEQDPNILLMQRRQSMLVSIHERLGHLSFSVMRLMSQANLLPRWVASTPPPRCPGCAYGKATRRPWRHKGANNRRHLKTATAPGEVVSVDQLVSPTDGFVPTHRGRPTLKRYKGATIFVDHYSDFTYAHLMTDMDAEATVEAKRAFERVLRTHGATVQHYHADNGLFDTKAFKTAVHQANQSITFCGVNAHHQNGKAERRIQDVTQGARTALLHAAHRWPKAITPALWPSALKHYINLRNSLPTHFVPGTKQGRKRSDATFDRSPISMLSRTEIEVNLDHFHPFGCPVYVLEDTLQSHHSHNKWSDRSRVGIFLCHSPHHSTNVPLILNTQTGNVSPQFHCLYDDEFNSCKRDAKFHSLWQWKAKLRSSPFTPTAQTDTLTTQPQLEAINLPEANPPNARFTVPWNQQTVRTEEAQHNELVDFPGDLLMDDESNQQMEENQPPTVAEQTETTVNDQIFTRSGRRSKPNPKYYGDSYANIAYLSTFSPGITQQANDCQDTLLQPTYEDEPHPFAFLTEVCALSATSDPDTMTLDEALRQPDKEEFIKAMYKELSDHIGRRHWKIVPRSSVPRHKQLIPMVWSMKRKRDPLGQIIKWKARLCAGGHRSIEFVDYWSTYSPVISWSTVRLVLVFALINGWYMESIDFVLAFPQAPIQTDIYMQPPKVPTDFIIPDMPTLSDRFTKCYKLIKNLYGLKDAGRTWYNHLRQGLLKRGWKPSDIDSCLFTKEGILLVVYVDDAILISPNKEQIALEIKSLQRDFALTDDGELKDYLGTRFTHHDDGSIELSQPRMIERVLSIVGLDKQDGNMKMHDTPATDGETLDADPDGQPRQQNWNYRSAVGSLSYLNAMVRPDITMAVQQCARFCNSPRKSHEEAVKRICRYLLRTKEKGLILRPDRKRGLECYVDADWAGSWQSRSSNDPLSAHSRTGYVVMYAGCPIIWASKMQPLIALSTTEAEYIALSTALREVISVINLMKELKDRNFNLYTPTPTINCKVFEDNKSCIEIATNHRTRPRTKHLSVRLHHFRSYVVDKTISIQHISTKDQIADMFTKPLARDQFRKLRSRLMQWDDDMTSICEGVTE